MVLAELGSQLAGALQNLTRASTIDDTVVNQLLSTITKALLASDVELPLVVTMQKNIKAKINKDKDASSDNLRKTIHSAVIQELYGLLDSGGKPAYELKKGRTNVVMFVGLQGSGKTTTVTKFAHYYQKRGWKTGLVCADTFRAGAFDQLKQNATKAKIPFYGSYTELDPVVVAEAGVRKFREDRYDLIVVDTSGRHKQEAALFEEMQEIHRATRPDDVVFVMDGSIGKSAKDQALAFRSAVDVGSVVITKLDGHAKGGGALSAVSATKSPIIFIGTGEHITNFEPFNPKSFVSRLLGMGDISGLLNLLSDSDNLAQATTFAKRMVEGKGFTFRDLSEQVKGILKLGPMSQIMSMMPAGMQLPAGHEKQAVSRMKRFMTVFDSMTPKELDGDPTPFNKQPSRVQRVARGAGCTVQQVEEILGSYKQFQMMADGMSRMAKGGGMDMSKMMGAMGGKGGKMPPGMPPGGMPSMEQLQQMMGGMGGMGGGPGGMGGMAEMMQQMMGGAGGGGGGGMQQMMQQMMSKMVDPQMMQRMGGMSGMQNMMNQMAAGKTPPGMKPPGGGRRR